jgi:cell wall-associated NlpC family hydrolase
MTTAAQRKAGVNLAEKLGFQHIPYVFGGITGAGMDCSGLTKLALEAMGYKNVEHNAALQAQWFESRGRLQKWTTATAKALVPGDVLFYQGPGGTTPEDLQHCGMFLFNFEGMHVIAQATQPGVGTEVIRAQKYEHVLFIGKV